MPQGRVFSTSETPAPAVFRIAQTYLVQWAIQGEVLLAINALAERQAQQAAPAMSPSRTAT